MTDTKGAGNGKPEGFGDDLTKAFEELSADDDGKLDDGEEAEHEEVEQEADEEEEQVVEVAAPEHWSDQDKEAFNSLPDEAKPLYLEKVKAIESGYNKKFEEVAQERKTLGRYKPFDDIFAPYQQELDRLGMSPDAYVKSLMATANALRAKPKETLAELARQFGVEFPIDQAQAVEEEFLDPAAAARIRQLEGQITELQRTTTDNLNKLSQANTTASQRQYLETWNSFTTSSQDGKPLYPHAERLKTRIGQELQLMSNEETAGKTLPDLLKLAYDRAAWVDESARADLLKTRQDIQRKAEVQKAKKAGRVVKSKSDGTSKAPAEAGSWKDGLHSAWDELSEA